MPVPTTMLSAFDSVIEASWQAAIIAILILIAQRMLPRQIGPRWRCAMWGLLLVRLAMVALPESRLSLFNLQPANLRPASFVIPDQVISIHLGTTPPPNKHAAAAASSPAVTINWHKLIAAVWAAGVIAALAQMLFSIALFSRKVRRTPAVIDRTLAGELLGCSQMIGLRRVPRVIETKLVSSPALFGIFKPVILLPTGLMQGLNTAERRFILLHELIHLKNHDILIGMIVWLFNAIHWFNPLLWVAAARFRTDREMVCDARVLELTDHSKNTEYAQIILKLMESTPALPSAVPSLAAMLGSRASIHRRIMRIANPTRSTRIWSMLAALLLLGIACVTLTRAQSKPATPISGPIVSRSFDIRDLIFDSDTRDTPRIATFPPPPGQPTTSASVGPTTAPRSRQQIVDELIQQLQHAVAPDSWRNDDPAGPSIRESGGKIEVKQSSANLDLISALLQQIRKERLTVIYVETRFLTGNVIADVIQLEFAQNGEKWEQRGNAEVWPAFLDDQQVSTILRASQLNANTTTLTAPRLTLFNKQRAVVAVSTDTAYVGDIKLKANDELDPQVKVVSAGVHMDCRAEMQPDEQSLAVSFHPKVSKLLRIDVVPWPAPPAARQAFIQVPYMSIAEIDEKFDIPSGKSLLVKLQPRVEPPDPAALPGPITFVLVRPLIITQKDAAP